MSKETDVIDAQNKQSDAIFADIIARHRRVKYTSIEEMQHEMRVQYADDPKYLKSAVAQAFALSCNFLRSCGVQEKDNKLIILN